ncbi:MAG: 23S rRNA (adenine(2503)-C(2))-methyltransferase RlmN [Bdellovibrio sp.]|nr:23S rRNA (adenine(2503)-C(2))-methyltransferase RlmN [Bdellovibrio sp.]
MIYFQSLTQSELAQLLLPLSGIQKTGGLTPEEIQVKSEKRARYRAKQLFHWVYQRGQTDWDQMTDLSKDLRQWLKENIAIFRLTPQLNQQALDGTHKFLWSLGDSKTIESVIIPAALQSAVDLAEDLEEEKKVPAGPHAVGSRGIYSGKATQDDLKSTNWKRLTACISSQVGCAMACKFCLTGIQGLDRHLGVHEIVTQVYELRRLAPITNIVFMGMGEPLHNFENVVKACLILLDQDGLGFSKRKVTISTSGLVPAIEELGRRVDVSLAISLNASHDEQRSKIMPVNRKWNLESLMKACREYPLGSHRRITFEYVLLKDINDSLEDAARVYDLLRGIPSKVNLIPFNEHPGSDFKRPSDENVQKFQKYLVDRKVTATIRISKGRDILAACGQLRSIFGTARGTEKHRDWQAQQA